MEQQYITLEESKLIQLSKNFTLYEFLKSDTASRLNIDNQLPVELLPKIKYLVTTILQPIRDEFGPIRVLSGYRNEKLSIKVGSNTNSNHYRGLAADIEPYDVKIPLIDIMVYINDNLSYKELIAEFFPTGWVHVAADELNNKADLKLKDKDNNYARVNIKVIVDKYQIT